MYTIQNQNITHNTYVFKNEITIPVLKAGRHKLHCLKEIYQSDVDSWITAVGVVGHLAGNLISNGS